ncbi:dorsal-ventral patterning protein tolloid [Trichonephila clavipes]|nr:dorsal-ventral patterning protein tolloid [Trichonephila clavipes]
MRARAYCAHPSIPDHWALRSMSRCPDQVVVAAVAEWYRSGVTTGIHFTHTMFGVSYPKRHKDACGGVIEETNGTIISPSFPDLYPPNKFCIWEIIAPPQYRITLNFTHFDLEGNNQDCEYDSVDIRSKMADDEVRKHGVFCGSRLPPLITSEGNSLRIEFSSDNSVQKSGFGALFFTVVELLNDWNVDVPRWKYPRNFESPRVSSPGFGNDSKMMKQTEHSIRPVSSALFRYHTTVSRQTVYRRLGHIVLYARRPVRCVPLTATHCRLRLTWSREHALWTPQQWSCVMFSNESRFSLPSDSRRTLIWRAPGTRYHQESTIERHHYGGAGWLVWGGIILGSRTDLHVQSVTMTSHIYRNVILEQHVRVFRGAMGAEFLFMDDNARPRRANIVDECFQSEDITRMDCPTYSPDLNPIKHVWDMLGRRIAARQPLPPVYRNFGGHCLMSGVIFPKIRLII